MKINEGIKVLWKEEFFSEERTPSQVSKELRDKFGINASNISSQLSSCKSFLIRNRSGWVQRVRYGLHKGNTLVERIHPFQELGFCQEIIKVSQKLYDDGHYPSAVFEAYIKVNSIVKKKSKQGYDGKNLMLNVFSEIRPILKINSLKTVTEKDEQEGYKFLFAGAILAIRNPKAHENVIQNSSQVALQYLALANLLIRQVKKSKLNSFTSYSSAQKRQQQARETLR